MAVRGDPLGPSISIAFQRISRPGLNHEAFACPFTWLFTAADGPSWLETPPFASLTPFLSHPPHFRPSSAHPSTRFLFPQGSLLIPASPPHPCEMRCACWLPFLFIYFFSTLGFFFFFFFQHFLPPEQTVTFLRGWRGRERGGRRWVR